MTVYIVLETTDPEIASITVFTTRALADAHFEGCAEENKVPEHIEREVLDREVDGTVRVAGDDAYCVQLIEQAVQDR